MAVVVPDIAEIFEEAYERAGLQMRSGYDLKTIRRSLNIIQLEWQNRGLNLFTIESGTESLVSGTSVYTMPTDTIDLIEHQVRSGSGTGQIDQNLIRMSVSTYAKISNKSITGKPSQIYIARTATAVTATLWPIPDSSDYTLSYYRLVGIDGLSSGIGTAASIPPRFVPALIAGLAFHVAMKRPEVASRVKALREEYEFQYRLAAEEDTDSSGLMITPWVGAV